MPLIIDGYNVIGRGRAYGLTLEQVDKEQRLLDLVARWRDRANFREEITVVFDGAGGGSGLPRYNRRGVQVVFALDRSADELIIARVEASKHPHRLTVVTADRAVERRCRAVGARVSSSEAFLDRIAAALSAGEMEKPESIGTGELEEWLRLFGDKTKEGKID